MAHYNIRRATAGDAAELARLTTQLGYPASEAAIAKRLAGINASTIDCLLVAEGTESRLAGWIHGFSCQLMESDYRVEIGGLVVDEAWRRKGVGKQLVDAIERWARERGATEVSVRCREERAGSHRFYEQQGFQHIKTQRVFRKKASRES